MACMCRQWFFTVMHDFSSLGIDDVLFVEVILTVDDSGDVDRVTCVVVGFVATGLFDEWSASGGMPRFHA